MASGVGGGIQECNARLGMAHVLATSGDAEAAEAEVARLAEAVDRAETHAYFAPFVHEVRARVAALRANDDLRRREVEEAARLHEAIGADEHAVSLRRQLDA